MTTGTRVDNVVGQSNSPREQVIRTRRPLLVKDVWPTGRQAPPVSTALTSLAICAGLVPSGVERKTWGGLVWLTRRVMAGEPWSTANTASSAPIWRPYP